MSNAIIQRVLHRLVNEIGPRPSASAANHAAEDFLAAEFARLGYTVERQEYAATAWEHRSTRLKLGGSLFFGQAGQINTRSGDARIDSPGVSSLAGEDQRREQAQLEEARRGRQDRARRPPGDQHRLGPDEALYVPGL